LNVNQDDQNINQNFDLENKTNVEDFDLNNDE